MTQSPEPTRVKNPKHKHDYVPVEILWLSIWGNLGKGKKPTVLWVATACECGAIKLVPAKLKNSKKELVEYYKEKYGD